MPGYHHWVSDLMILAGGLIGSFCLRAMAILGMAGLDVLAYGRQAKDILTLPTEMTVVLPDCYFSETDNLSQCFSNFNMNVDDLQILFKYKF